MSKKYITGIHRQTVGAGVIAAKRQAGAPRWVQIQCSSKENGQAVMGAISACQPQWKYTKSDTTFGNLVAWSWIPGGGLSTANWKTFRVQTKSAKESQELVKDIGNCMEEYGGSVSDVGDAVYSKEDEGQKSSGISKTAIYLIAGAVVVVFIGLILTRKKK